VHGARQSPERPVLITDAPVSVDVEFEHRRRRYLLMMILRAGCVVGAASTFRVSGWLAAAFVLAAVTLPWMAVLIANDRPPKQELRFRRFLARGAHDDSATAHRPPTLPSQPAGAPGAAGAPAGAGGDGSADGDLGGVGDRSGWTTIIDV
jgi:hypothetical protein